jgi:hypothetical protein
MFHVLHAAAVNRAVYQSSEVVVVIVIVVLVSRGLL